MFQTTSFNTWNKCRPSILALHISIVMFYSIQVNFKERPKPYNSYELGTMNEIPFLRIPMNAQFSIYLSPFGKFIKKCVVLPKVVSLRKNHWIP